MGKNFHQGFESIGPLGRQAPIEEFESWLRIAELILEP